MRESTHGKAQGRWPEILATLGVPDAMLNTRKHHPCPWCGGKDRFRFTDQDGSGRFYCGQCGPHSPIDVLMQMNGWQFAEAAGKVDDFLGRTPKPQKPHKSTDEKRRREGMKTLWSRTLPIERGDFVDRYLAGRGIVLDAFPPCLRKLHSMEHCDEDLRKSMHPGLVSKITAPDGNGTNLHRTYLTFDGTKADVSPIRKTMAGGIAQGSAVRLFDFTSGVLGVAEGIETAFSASILFGVPVWSALNSSIMQGWEPPPETTEVVIFGDNDPKFGGQAAANALAHRLSVQRGLSVQVRIPPNPGTDWNDVLMKRRNAA